MADEHMPKLNLDKDSLRLTKSDLHHMKRMEKLNLDRALLMKKMRFNARIIGVSLGCIAASIYAYTIYAIKQERFLDDFLVPETIEDDD